MLLVGTLVAGNGGQLKPDGAKRKACDTAGETQTSDTKPSSRAGPQAELLSSGSLRQGAIRLALADRLVPHPRGGLWVPQSDGETGCPLALRPAPDFQEGVSRLSPVLSAVGRDRL